MSAMNRATAFEVDVGSIIPLQGMSGRGGLLSNVSASPDAKPNTIAPVTTIKPMGPV